LRRQIKQDQMEAGTPPRKPFQLDESQRILSGLKRVVDSRGRLPADEESDEQLPVARETTPKRIVWNIDLDGGAFQLEPILQQRKKRGDGYTKGKVLPLKRLFQDRSLPLDPIDQAIRDHVTVESQRYYTPPDYDLDPLEALEELVDCDRVTLNRNPAVIRVLPHYLRVHETADGCRLLFCDDRGERVYGHSLCHTESIIRIDKQAGELAIGPRHPQEVDLLEELLRFGTVASERRGELIETVRPLQERLSIFLPEDAGGRWVFETATPVVLLRSRSDGQLDFGLRVRDAAGKLRRPLRGPMITACQREGESVQVIRVASQERAMLQHWLDQWQLTVEPQQWGGTVEDFGKALRLVEALQDPACPVETLWDRHSEKPLTVLGNLGSQNVKVEIKNKRNWFGVTGECNFGDRSLTLPELLAGLPDEDQDRLGDYVRLGDGQWARISAGLRERLRELKNATHADRKTLKLDATAAPAVQRLADSEVAVKASKAWEKCIQRLANAEKLDPVVPEGLDAELRDYQVDGYKWLRRLAEWGVGGILADDMGLGKTLQTLAVLLDRRHDGPALVIAPTSVGFNWVREAERFAPDLDVHLYRETERSDFLPQVGPGSLVVCSYGLALRDAEALAEVPWSTLVLDEAQAIKNSRSKTSKAIASLDADWTVALTGTPVENHLGELWSLFHVVSPGVFGGWEQFRKRFAAKIEKEGDEAARHALAERLKPFVLRRTKEEVLTELPPRTEMNLYVDLSPAERAEYEKVRLAAIGEAEAIADMPQIQDQRFRILALMTRLRQIACHAGLVNKQWTGSSAKLDQLRETLESLREEGHRALVFSQFTEHLALIRQALEEGGFSYEYLDGSTPAAARQKAVDRFQNGDADAFLISLKAGGTGLNLTAADYVIHMDPWWNPAVEDQATDRAHRIGQELPVMVYRIVARGTIEEEILALHESKRDLVTGVMAGTEAAAKLSNEDLVRMLRGE
jgi:superfamily II DNA or RNA helicase